MPRPFQTTIMLQKTSPCRSRHDGCPKTPLSCNRGTKNNNPANKNKHTTMASGSTNWPALLVFVAPTPTLPFPPTPSLSPPSSSSSLLGPPARSLAHSPSLLSPCPFPSLTPSHPSSLPLSFPRSFSSTFPPFLLPSFLPPPSFVLPPRSSPPPSRPLSLFTSPPPHSHRLLIHPVFLSSSLPPCLPPSSLSCG